MQGPGGWWWGWRGLRLEWGTRSSVSTRVTQGVGDRLLLANGVCRHEAIGGRRLHQLGWRVPFLLSGVLVLVGLWTDDIAESPLFAEVERPTTRNTPRSPGLRPIRSRCCGGGARVGVEGPFTLHPLRQTYVATFLECQHLCLNESSSPRPCGPAFLFGTSPTGRFAAGILGRRVGAAIGCSCSSLCWTRAG